MSSRTDPRPPAPHQSELAWAYSAQRKRVKRLKRDVARAERVRREGLGPRDVPCPHCGAPPFVSVKRDPGHCRTPGGPRSHGGPLPHHANHRVREEEAARQKAALIRAGELAQEQLRSRDR